MIALAAVLSSTITFAGGDDIALSRFVESQYHRPVAILAETGRKWPKAAYVELSDKVEERRILAQRLDATSLKDNVFGISKAPWPLMFYDTQWRDRYKGFGEAPEVQVEDGKVSVRCAKGDLDIEQALPAALQAKVEMHWFYKQARLVIVAVDVPVDEYVSLVAKAVGAKVVRKEKDYYLDFDPAEYRRRAISLMKGCLERGEAHSPIGLEDFDFSSQVLGAISDADLTKYMRSQESTNLPGPLVGSLEQSAVRRIKARFPVEPNDRKYDPTVVAAWARISSDADISKLYAVYFPFGFAAIMVKGRVGTHVGSFVF